MTPLNQFSLYNQSVPPGISVTSAKFIGNTNNNNSLSTPSGLALFIKGANSNVLVTLQIAYCPTNNSQQQQPLETDYLSYESAYNDDEIKMIPNLNGLWYRFLINNNSSGAAVLTCNLGN